MFGDMQVDHELRQCAMQPRDRATQQRKARAGQLGGGFKVQPAELFAEGNVVFDFEIELSRRAPAAHFDVVVFVLADRNRLVRQVRDTEQDRIEFGLDRIQLDLASAQLARHALDVRHQRRDVFATLLGLPDGFGTRVTFSLQCFGAGLDGLALFFQRFDARGVQGKATGSQAVRYVLKVAT